MNRSGRYKRNIIAIILAGSRDFGSCSLASRLPPALWPIAGKPVLERLLQHLVRQGIKQAVVCSNGSALLLRGSISDVDSMQLRFLDELLPIGTAGCIRDAAGGDTNSLFLVLRAATISLPQLETLVEAHQRSGSDLTVILKPEAENGQPGGLSGQIYICGRTVLECIPEQGYFDIKEGLIPVMLRAGKIVRVVKLSENVSDFRDRSGYLTAISEYLRDGAGADMDLPGINLEGSSNIWLASGAKVAENARIYEPVVVMDGAVVSEKAVIFGPTIVGSNVVIGSNSLVENSVLWAGSSVGRNCEIHRCVVDYDSAVPRCSVLEDTAVVHQQNRHYGQIGKAVSLMSGRVVRACSATEALIFRAGSKLPDWAQSEQLKSRLMQVLWISILAGVFIWSYWPGLRDLWGVWQRSDEYSSGLLVPFLALYVLWARRERLARCRIRPSIWGLFAFLAAQGVRYFGLFFMYSSAERLSLVLSMASVVLLLFGWHVVSKIWAVLLFLCLMLPLPQSIHFSVMLPLQGLATGSAVFLLEMMGYSVLREGNIININGNMVAVSEACNGLRMVTSFFIISGLVVLLMRRAWWEKLIVLASSLPVALLCNVVRLTVTAVAFTFFSQESWKGIFHDFSGYAMMPFALGVVIFELWLLTKLTAIPKEAESQIIFRGRKN